MKQTVLRKGPELRRRILLGVVFLTPLLFLRNAYDTFNTPKLWLLMVAVAVVATIRGVELLQGAERYGLALMVVPAAAFAGPLIVATVVSPYRVWSLIGDHSRFTGLIPYLVVIALAILIADGFRGDIQPLGWSLVASTAVAGAYAVVQVLGLDPFEWSEMNQAVGTIGNTNFAGAFFAICLPVAVGLLLVETRRRSLLVVFTLLVAAGWVLAFSEAAWAAGTAGLLILGGTLLSARWNAARFVGLLAAAAIAAAGVGLVLVAMIDDPPGFIPESVERRAEWWQASWRMSAESPLFGEGPNSFAIEHTHHRDIDDALAVGSDVTDDPHSLPLLFLTGAGIFGLVGFLTFAGWILLTLLKVNTSHPLAAGFAGAVSAYVIQSLLSVDVISLRFAGWTAAAALAAALAPLPSARSRPFARKKKKKVKEVAEPLSGLPAVAGLILIASLAVFWATGFLRADIAFQRGLSPTTAGVSAQESFRSAIGFRESNDTYRREYGRILGANATRQALDEDGDEAEARAFLEEAKQTLSFIDDFPHANSVLVYARVMRDWAQVDDAAEARALELYERAAELDPYNFRIFDEAAAAAASFGREDVARELTERSAQLQRSAED